MSTTYKAITPFEIEQIVYPIIMAPFFGVMIPVRLRELTQAQISSCGDFSLIETFDDKVSNMSKRQTEKETYEQLELMVNVLRESLVEPSYDEIIKMYDKDNKIIEARKTMEELRKKIFEIPRGPQKTNLEKELFQLKIRYEFLLPEDFIGFVWSYALGINKSEINKVSEKMLFDAAVLAEKGHDNPSDHIEGKWPEVQRGFYLDNINKKAWYILHKYREEHYPKKNKKGLTIG